MWKWLGEFLYYSRGERRGILALLGVALLLLLGGEMYVHLQSKRADNPDDHLEQEQAMEEYRAFSASIREKEKEEKESRKSRYMAWEEEFVPPVLAPFNPNTTDSATFRQLGLPAWMARNILRYREKGGVFRRAEDFRKIYGLTEKQYNTLRPYIHIPATDSTDHHPSLFLAKQYKDSIQQAKPLKYAPGTLVDLNRAAVQGQHPTGKAVEIRTWYFGRPEPCRYHRIKKDSWHRKWNRTSHQRISPAVRWFL